MHAAAAASGAALPQVVLAVHVRDRRLRWLRARTRLPPAADAAGATAARAAAAASSSASSARPSDPAGSPTDAVAAAAATAALAVRVCLRGVRRGGAAVLRPARRAEIAGVPQALRSALLAVPPFQHGRHVHQRGRMALSRPLGGCVAAIAARTESPVATRAAASASTSAVA